MSYTVVPKRRSPFDEVVHHQSKIFVTEAMLCSRSSCALPDLKKSIHEKTLSMLYQGAKKQKVNSGVQDPKGAVWMCIHSEEPDAQDKKYKQLQLNASGQLVMPQSNAVGMDFAVHSADVADLEKCSYCDVILRCGMCRQECNNCRQFFCPKCCLNIPRGREDCCLCLSCAH